jgi:hypothetical protein
MMGLVIGYWLLVIGYWLLVIGYWLLVIGCWLLALTSRHDGSPGGTGVCVRGQGSLLFDSWVGRRGRFAQSQIGGGLLDRGIWRRSI